MEELPLSILKDNTREMKHPVLACVTQGDLLPKLKPLTYSYRGSPEVRVLWTLLRVSILHTASYGSKFATSRHLGKRTFNQQAVHKGNGGVLNFLDSLNVLS